MTSLSYKVSSSPPLPTPPPDEDDEPRLGSNQFLPPPPPPRRLARTPPPAPPFQPRRGSLWDFVKSEATGAWDSVGSLARSKDGVESFHPTELPLEAAKAARILRSFTMESIDLPLDNPTPEQQQLQAKKAAKVMKKIPPSAMEHCQGLAIFTVMRTGFLVSGAGGSGVVLARLPDGTWSPPSGILIHTIGFGVVAAADVYDIVLLLRTTKAVKSFSHPRLTLGGELAISQGPWDLGANGAGLRVLETGVEISPVWSYVKSKSSYGGVQVDGNVVIERNDENERSYGRPVTSLELLDGQVPAPSWASGLHQTILAAEGKEFSPALIPVGTSPSEGLSPSLEGHIPSSSSSVSSSNDPSPSILSIRRTSSSTSSSLGINSIRKLPQEDLDDEDLQAQREMEAMLKEFGIENPNINKELREVDPLLVRGKSHSNEGSQKTSFVDHTPPLTPPQVQGQEQENGERRKSFLEGYSMKVEKSKSKDGEEEGKANMAGLGLTGVDADKVSVKSSKAESVKSAKESVQSSRSTRASIATAPEKGETSAAEEDGDIATPTETEKEVTVKEEIKAAGKPIVPPRRSPKVAQDTKSKESGSKVEKDGEEDEEDEEDNFENFETPTVEQE